MKEARKSIRLARRASSACFRVGGLLRQALWGKYQLEHFSEIVLTLIIGGTLFLNSWNWPAVFLTLFVFLVARPVGVWLTTFDDGSSIWLTPFS